MTKLALLFDLDGTLIDSIGLLQQSMEFAFADRLHRPTVESWTAGIGKPLRVQMTEWAKDGEDVETLVNLYREYQDLNLERLTTIYPHVLDVLQSAKSKGHKLGLVTSKGLGMTARSLAHVKLAGLFDVEVTVESTARHKPLPDPVLFALESLQMPTHRAVFVGDSTHDMHSGRAASVLTAAAKWGPFSSEELEPTAPDFWLDSMLDLNPIIARLESQA